MFFNFGTTTSERRRLFLGEVGSKCPKKGREFSGCHLLKLVMLVRDYENAKQSVFAVGFEPPRAFDRQRVRLTAQPLDHRALARK